VAATGAVVAAAVVAASAAVAVAAVAASAAAAGNARFARSRKGLAPLPRALPRIRARPGSVEGRFLRRAEPASDLLKKTGLGWGWSLTGRA